MPYVQPELITIVVPIYNVEDYLPACIDSITNQTYTNLEILLIDDGSTDRSGEICDSYAESDQRIVVVHQANCGISIARNRGINLAKGKFINFIDSDDIVSPYMIENMHGFMHDYDIIECGVRRFMDGDEIKYDCEHPAIEKSFSKEQALAYLFDCPGMSASFCNKLFLSSLFDGLRFKDGIIHEDEYLIFRVFDRIQRLGIISTADYFYRTRENSIMNTPNSLKQLDAIWAWEDRQEYCRNRGYSVFELRANALLYYECVNLYRKEFFKQIPEAKAYIEKMISKYKSEFIKNSNIKLKHRIIMALGNMYKVIF